MALFNDRDSGLPDPLKLSERGRGSS